MWFLFFHSDDKTALLLFNNAFILLIHKLFQSNYQRCSWDIVTWIFWSPKRDNFSHLCVNNSLFWCRARDEGVGTSEIDVAACTQTNVSKQHLLGWNTHTCTHMHTHACTCTQPTCPDQYMVLHMDYMSWAASAGVSHSWMIYPFSVSLSQPFGYATI